VTETSRLRHAVTVDVEDYFQVLALSGAVARADWDDMPRRVVGNTERILDLFAEAGARGTFFTLGWVADRHPALVRRIVAEGHELASHGYGHELVNRLTEAEFRADLARARATLEDTGGIRVIGYRAPTFSIGPSTPWAYRVLAEEGHLYSSSLYPVRHDLYGMPDAPRHAFRPNDGIWEFPMTTVHRAGRRIPCSGGGYFRLLPYPVFRANLRRWENTETMPGIFYTHPWEIDPGQPRIPVASRLSRFRHYVNLSKTEAKLRRLLRDFAWDRMDRVFAGELTGRAGRPRNAAQLH
jgi:polysaccharide deacetylase family protein (PEP-CTERM system associated)